MNLSYFIAKRISDPGHNSFSSVIHKIAIASIALGLAIMVGAYLILGGFQRNIKDKIFSFSGHIQVQKFSLNTAYESEPITMEGWRMDSLRNDPYVDHIQEFAYKPGLMTKKDEVYGVLYKGVAPSFRQAVIEEYLIEGEFLQFSDSAFSPEVLISQRMAKDMELSVGDQVITYFIMDPPRTRRLQVKGIFKTELENFDEQVMIGDIELIRGLNDWKANEVGGYEIFVRDIDEIAAADDSIIEKLSIEHYTEKADEKYIQIFDWLSLLSQNVHIFLGLILFVACFNMISVIFILIMERTRMIGTFKALGATNKLIRSIFAYNGFRLVLKGMLIGNLIALSFGAIQYYFEVIPLDPENYYMEFVPIRWNWTVTALLNALVFVVVSAVLIIPTTLISNIRPVKAIRFDSGRSKGCSAIGLE